MRPLTAISIHSLRVEGDRNAKAAIAKAEISIHSLRVEGDLLGKERGNVN